MVNCVASIRVQEVGGRLGMVLHEVREEDILAFPPGQVILVCRLLLRDVRTSSGEVEIEIGSVGAIDCVVPRGTIEFGKLGIVQEVLVDDRVRRLSGLPR